MHVSVEVTKQVPCELKKSFVTKVVQETLKVSGYDFLAGKRISVSVVFVSPDEIRKLNKEYRHKNKVTDVLSFPEYAKKQEMIDEVSDAVFLGDLIICYDYIVNAAEEDEVSLEQEMAYIISHGILHLLGFRHSERMFSLQDGVSEAYA